jgi:hypothetical protein
MDDRVLNPWTWRWIKRGKPTYESLVNNGYQPTRIYNKSKTGSIIVMKKPVNIMDDPIPDIKVETLKPSTTFQNFKNKIVKNASTFADWLLKLAENRKKNANELADWIINETVTLMKKVLPTKIQDLINLSKNTKYKDNIITR